MKRAGTKLVVAAGLTLMAAGFAVAATTDAASSYGIIVVAMVFMGSGLGVALTPATESILGALPRDQAGVGSAVNDTTREVGGTLGVAVLGSIMAYALRRQGGRTRCAAPGLPAALRLTAGDSLAAALQIASRVGGTAGAGIARTAQDAFVHAFQVGSMVTGCVALAGAAIALVFLPARVAGEERLALVVGDGVGDRPGDTEAARASAG